MGQGVWAGLLRVALVLLGLMAVLCLALLGLAVVALWWLAASLRRAWFRLLGRPQPAGPDLRRWQNWARQTAQRHRPGAGAASGQGEVIDVEARELR